MKAFDAKYLPYMAGFFQAVQFAFAGSVLIGPTGWLLGGIGGIVVNLAVANAASKISDIAQKRKPLAWTGFIALMALSPLAVGYASYLAMSVIEFMPMRIITAIVWAIIPDAAILLTGAITGRSLIILGSETQTAPQSKGSAPKVRRTADALRTECAALSAQYACTEPQCGWNPDVDALIASAKTGKSARGAAASSKAGHMKNRHPKPIVIDQSLLIKKENQS